MRHVAQLHKARLAVETGADTGSVLSSFIPALHFSRKTPVEAALTGWTAQRLERAMEKLAEAIYETRRLARPAR